MKHPNIIDEVYVRWCSCGLMIAGTARQVLDQCEVHWRRGHCAWVLHQTKPVVR